MIPQKIPEVKIIIKRVLEKIQPVSVRGVALVGATTYG